MKHLGLGLAVVASLLLGTSMASAEISFSGREAVVPETGYAGPGFTWAELGTGLAGIGVGTAALYLTNPAFAVAVPEMVFVGLGAKRVETYRPQATKDGIHARMADAAKKPAVGTVWEILQK